MKNNNTTEYIFEPPCLDWAQRTIDEISHRCPGELHISDIFRRSWENTDDKNEFCSWFKNAVKTRLLSHIALNKGPQGKGNRYIIYPIAEDGTHR